jgi:hypothetical protein
MKQLRHFLRELDDAWKPLGSSRQALPLIGSGALMLLTDYERGTKDGDVFQTSDITDSVKSRLLALGGKGSSLHARHRLYVDVVSSGLPFLPHAPVWHPLSDVNATLTHFDVLVLDVVDVVVSKLKRFHANDRADINAMIERGLVAHARLVQRFESAVDVWKDGAGAEDLPRYVANLHALERDEFFVAESEIDLPPWI